MRNTFYPIIFIVFLAGCCFDSVKQKATTNTLEETILEIALKDTISTESFIKTHFLLSNLVLTELQIDLLKQNLLKHEKDSIKFLIYNYQLWIQTQETEYRDNFIQYYPTGNSFLQLNKAISNCDYRTVISPLLNTLVSFAKNNDDALRKIIKIMPYLGAASADGISYRLQDIYEIDKKRFINVSNDLEIDINEVIYNK